jgi:predicted 2-oxoglutarate/Fe(II)-dependent dioxygenase YbiX
MEMVNTFFSKEECDDITLICEKIGITFNHGVAVLNPWDNRKIHNDEFKERILKRYREVFKNTPLPFDLELLTIDNIYITLTRYFDGRFLEMHKDTSSDLTSVIVLTDEFVDGRFVLSKESIKIENNVVHESLLHNIEKGNGLTFYGGETFHGVMPVVRGIRKSLNIWVNPTTFKMNVGDLNLVTKTNKTFL